VQLPAAPQPAPATGAAAGVPWYRELWREVTEGPR
jgi:hypothetical protein